VPYLQIAKNQRKDRKISGRHRKPLPLIPEKHPTFLEIKPIQNFKKTRDHLQNAGYSPEKYLFSVSIVIF